MRSGSGGSAVNCAYCGRRIKTAAATLPPGVVDGLPYAGGPVGPVCAKRFGLLQVNPKPSLFLSGVPVRASRRQVARRTETVESDPRQLDLLQAVG